MLVAISHHHQRRTLNAGEQIHGWANKSGTCCVPELYTIKDTMMCPAIGPANQRVSVLLALTSECSVTLPALYSVSSLVVVLPESAIYEVKPYAPIPGTLSRRRFVSKTTAPMRCFAVRWTFSIKVDNA